METFGGCYFSSRTLVSPPVAAVIDEDKSLPWVQHGELIGVFLAKK